MIDLQSPLMIHADRFVLFVFVLKKGETNRIACPVIASIPMVKLCITFCLFTHGPFSRKLILRVLLVSVTSGDLFFQENSGKPCVFRRYFSYG